MSDPFLATTLKDSIKPATRFVKITASSAVLNYRSYLVTVDGTIDVLDWEDHAETGVVVKAGSAIPVCFKSITGITSATIYGIG